MTPEFDAITPHPEGIDPEQQILHERAYIVRAYRKDADTLVLRGAIRDQKPPGLYIPGDTENLTVHHMIVDMHIAVPTLEIKQANVVLETHPHANCPRIEDHYQKLVGMSIARGYTHKVRELFGGPRGCTHTTALLQAMGPVAIQSMWSFRVVAAREMGITREQLASMGPEARERSIAMNLNTCHIWAEDGEQVAAVREGRPMEVPVWIQRRYSELGMDPDTWRSDV